ncbi:ATP-binding protein [Terrilactibacillus sp. S3-3]|nr:ATP-binding protein [Terrilactibacillus sp. S3-3]
MKEIVEAHGWEIQAYSQEGIGTTIEILFRRGDIVEETTARG